MKVELRSGDVDLSSLIPEGELRAVRDEWLCHTDPPSRRHQVWVATALREAIEPFSQAARSLGAEVEQWGPGRAYRRARGPGWIAVVADATTGVEPVVDLAFDFRQVPRQEVEEGALRALTEQPELAVYLPLSSELSLPILLTSIERNSRGFVKGYVQFGIDEGSWPRAQAWLDASGFRRVANEEWRREGALPCSVLLGAGKIWATVGA